MAEPTANATETSRRIARPTIWAISEYYQPNFSGAAIQAHRILSRLASAGFAIHVLTAADQAARHLAGEVRFEEGVYIHYLPVLRRRDWSRRRAPAAVRRTGRATNELLRDGSFHREILRTLKRKAQPGDILQWYIVGEFTWMVVRAADRRLWHNVIQISLMGADDPSSIRAGRWGISATLKRDCFRRAARVIGLSRALVESCLQAGLDPQRVVRIPNGVCLERFPPRTQVAKQAARESLGLDPQRQYLAFVGSALHRKGIDVVIEAFIHLASRLPHVDLLVIGPCDFHDATRHDVSRQELVDQLKERLREVRCAERVHWVGQVENVPEYLRAADVLFFPTRREGLPNALSEGMAAGLPVVASRLRGVTTDLVNDGVEGRLIDGHDPRSYAEALIDLLEHPAQLDRMAYSARQRIEQEFNLDQIVEKYASLYEQLNRGRLPVVP